MRRLIVLLATVALLVAVAGCGSDSDSGSSTSSTTERDATCAAKDRLQSSLDDLTDPTVLTQGKEGVTDALDEVQEAADDLGSQVSADLQPQVQDVRNALDRLQSDVEALGDRNISESISKIGDDISAVGSAAGALSDSLQERCPS